MRQWGRIHGFWTWTYYLLPHFLLFHGARIYKPLFFPTASHPGTAHPLYPGYPTLLRGFSEALSPLRAESPASCTWWQYPASWFLCGLPVYPSGWSNRTSLTSRIFSVLFAPLSRSSRLPMTLGFGLTARRWMIAAYLTAAQGHRSLSCLRQSSEPVSPIVDNLATA